MHRLEITSPALHSFMGIFFSCCLHSAQRSCCFQPTRLPFLPTPYLVARPGGSAYQCI